MKDLAKPILLNKLDRALNILEDSPLFDLSLGSKELFHSNFLGMLFEKHPELCKDLFNLSGKIKILRERFNFDLLIIDTDLREGIIIENKFKAIPCKEQLEKYSQSLSSKGEYLTISKDELNLNKNIKIKIVRKYLLTPHTNSIGVEGWIILDYREVLKRLEEARINDKKIEYLVNDYIKFTGALLEIIDFIRERTSLGTTLGEMNQFENKKLRELRILDLYQKISYEYALNLILTYIDQNYKELPYIRASASLSERRKLKDGAIQKNVGYIRGSALLEIVFAFEHGVQYFIQLQGTSLKLMIIAKDLRNKSKEQILKAKNKDLFNFEDFELTRNCKVRENFNKYDFKDGYDIKYKYRRLDEKVTIEQLAKFFMEKTKEVQDKDFQKIIEVLK